jgi:hypothetical protein
MVSGIDLPRIHAFDGTSLDAVGAAFRRAPSIEMAQSWRESLEADFAPGTVRLGWRDDALLVFAELTDHDVFTRATEDNQRFWELGDTFEMFFRPEGQSSYVELHVAPNGLRLQLRFSDADWLTRVPRTDPFATSLVMGEVFRASTWLQPDRPGWSVLAEIPAASVFETTQSLPGATWYVSFSRYDDTRGRVSPVISSTSAHALPSFHRQQEWRAVRFTQDSWIEA